MDCLGSAVAVEQFLSESAGVGCGNRTVASTEEAIICPAPCRPSRFPYIVDNLNKICGMSKRSGPMHRRDTVELLNCFLGKDDVEDDQDNAINQKGFFCGSPPVRTNNPLVHDIQFVRQASHFSAAPSSPLGKPTARAERVPSCGASSLGGKTKPMVRIEGFACGGAESQCFVPALA